MPTYFLISALKRNDTPTTKLIHEREYEGPPEEYFVASHIKPGSAKEHGTVDIVGRETHMLDLVYESMD